jgi:hypothetical protein
MIVPVALALLDRVRVHQGAFYDAEPRPHAS